jgi:hypothetical protein
LPPRMAPRRATRSPVARRRRLRCFQLARRAHLAVSAPDARLSRVASEDDNLEEQAFDPLLGQRRMVADPRISAAQAATVLGKTVEHVHRLMALGRLPRHGPPSTFWQLRLSDVERLRDRGEPIPLKEAARLLRCATDDVRTLIADGKLTAVPGSRRPVYLLEVQALAAALDLPPRPHRPLPPEDHVNTREAARMLGRSISRIRQLAAEGRIPAQRDENGNYWYKPDHLEMVRRAWFVAEANDRGEALDPRTPPP